MPVANAPFSDFRSESSSVPMDGPFRLENWDMKEQAL